MKTTVRKSGVIAVTINAGDGAERTVSTGTDNPRLAKRILKASQAEAIEIAAKAGALSKDLIQKILVGKKVSVADAIAQWEEWINSVSASNRTAFCHISYVRKWSRDSRVLGLNITDIKESHISKWLNADDGNKISTKRAAMAAVRSFFNFCSIKQYCYVDPTRLVRIKAHLLSHEQKEPRHKQVFTDEEFAKLVAYIDAELKDLMNRPKSPANVHKIGTMRFWYCASIIGRYSGLRMEDICSLEWKCFDKPGKLIVWTQKRHVRVELPVTDELANGIAAIPTNSRRHCFPEQDAIIRDQSKRCIFSVQFGRLLQGAGVQGHSFHDLRHTLATELNANGHTLEAIAEALGHRSKETTKGYIHAPKDPGVTTEPPSSMPR